MPAAVRPRVARQLVIVAYSGSSGRCALVSSASWASVTVVVLCLIGTRFYKPVIRRGLGMSTTYELLREQIQAMFASGHVSQEAREEVLKKHPGLADLLNLVTECQMFQIVCEAARREGWPPELKRWEEQLREIERVVVRAYGDEDLNAVREELEQFRALPHTVQETFWECDAAQSALQLLRAKAASAPV